MFFLYNYQPVMSTKTHCRNMHKHFFPIRVVYTQEISIFDSESTIPELFAF